jgi:octaprenyl-diphosphate synthase
MLTILMARALGYRGDDILPLACSLEFLHSATLLHDDIVDGARLRRGRQSAHLLFGATHTILVGDALLALANRLVAEYGIPALTRHLSEALLRTATGEIQEIATLRDTNLTIETYYEIITGKTAFLIQAACRCGAVLAGASPTWRRPPRTSGGAGASPSSAGTTPWTTPPPPPCPASPRPPTSRRARSPCR